MVDLRTTYGGVELNNPLIIGGGPTSGFPELCGKAARAGWGALVLKTNMADDILNRYPNIVKVVRPFYKLADDRGRKWKPRVPKQSDGRSRDGKKLGKIEPDYTLVFDWQLDGSTGDVYSGHGGFYHGDDQYLKYISESKKAVQGTGCKIIASVTAFTEEGWEQQCNLVNRSDADMPRRYGD